MAKHDDIAQDKKLVKKAMKAHDTQQHGGKATKLGFKKGGPTSLDYKKYGANLARAKNQSGALK